MHKFFSFFALAVVLGLTGCTSTNPATGERVFSLVGTETELQMGKDVVDKAIKQDGLYKEKPNLTNYYRNLGDALIKVTERQDIPYNFVMLNAATMNAWAIPGYINMYRGILPYFNSEAEFMAVLAHEAGHITARHTARQFSRGTVANLLLTGASIAVGAQTGSDSAVKATQQLGGMAAQAALSGYSRSYEREADDLAMRYMQRLGYDPRQAYHVFETFDHSKKLYESQYKLLHNGQTPPRIPFYNVFLSHPDPKERMQRVVEAHGKPDGSLRLPQGIKPATPANDPHGQKRYFDKIDGIAVGPMPEDGVRGKDILYHEDGRFIWNTPAGSYFAPMGGLWQGITPDNVHITMNAAELQDSEDEMDPEELLRRAFPGSYDFTRVDVQGRLGYLARYNAPQPFSFNDTLRGDMILAAVPTGRADPDRIKMRRFIIFTFKPYNGQTDAAFMAKAEAAVQNIRYLGRSAAERIEPLRLDIRTVQPGDTFQKLASKLPMNRMNEVYFSAINRITPDSPLVPGMMYKAVIDPNIGKF